MAIKRKDLRVFVEREPYDKANPYKRRESILRVWHVPSNITVVKQHMVQNIALEEAIEEIEELLKVTK